MQEPEAKKIQEEIEAGRNLAGFFGLLWEIDKRVNPHFYETVGNSVRQDRIRTKSKHGKSPTGDN